MGCYAGCMARDAGSVVVPSVPDGFPPLMLVVRGKVSQAAHDRIRAEVGRALAERMPIAFDDSVKVYQLVNGRWQAID